MASRSATRRANRIQQRNVPFLKPMRSTLRPLALRPSNIDPTNEKTTAEGKRQLQEPITKTVSSIVSSKSLALVAPAKFLQPFKPIPLPQSVVDIDADDAGQLELCSEYAKDIYRHLFQLELKYAAKPQYLMHHPSLQPHMRGKLISWLVALQDRFRLLQDTLIMAVSILDRFMSEVRCEVSREKFQLVGVGCMLVASKYEEEKRPTVIDLTYVCDGAYTTWDIRCMECLILDTLHFELGKPLSIHFLRRFSKAGRVNFATHLMAKYLIELALFEHSVVHCRPSVIAAAALSIAGAVTDDVHWNDILHSYSGYRLCDLESVCRKMENLAATAREARSLEFTYRRFATNKCQYVAQILERSPMILKRRDIN